MTGKSGSNSTVPPPVVTRQRAAAYVIAGTRARICVADSTVNGTAGTFDSVTEVAFVKFEPVMTTSTPTAALVAEIDEIAGAAGRVTVNSGS